MPDPATPQDRAAWRSGLRETARELLSQPAVTGPVARVIFCRGCQHAWVDRGASMAALDAGTAASADDCACTCTDDRDPLYEAWVVDPDEDDLPEGIWVS